jgi:hypothetical protein
MYLPNKDFLDYLEKMLTALGMPVYSGGVSPSPVLTFEFEGRQCWVMAMNTGYKVFSEREDAIKTLQKMFNEALQIEEKDG